MGIQVYIHLGHCLLPHSDAAVVPPCPFGCQAPALDAQTRAAPAPSCCCSCFSQCYFLFRVFCPNEDFFSIHVMHCFTVTKPSGGFTGGFSTFYLGSVFGVAKKKAPRLLPKPKFLEKWETNRGGQSAHLHLTKYFSACS